MGLIETKYVNQDKKAILDIIRFQIDDRRERAKTLTAEADALRGVLNELDIELEDYDGEQNER